MMIEGYCTNKLLSYHESCRRTAWQTHAHAHAHAHDHAHASFISTTTKPVLPDSATNTDYDTLTLTAFTTTPICNLLQPGTEVGLPCLLPAYLGTRARMARNCLVFELKGFAWLKSSVTVTVTVTVHQA
jgi:hypothetical protein